MNKKLSRRDFLKLAGVTSAGLALSACGVKATELPTATLIPPTGTPLPTETLTPTLTSTPILPLEQLPQTKQALTEFVKAFKAVGVDISTDQLIQKGLEIRTITGKDTKQYEMALAHIENFNGLGGDYPLMIKAEMMEWGEYTLAQGANITATSITAQMSHWDLERPLVQESFEKTATRFMLGDEMRTEYLFNKTQWKNVIGKWEAIQEKLNKGEIPQDLEIDFSWMNKLNSVLDWGEKNGITGASFVGGWIGGGDAIGDSLLNANFSQDETWKILECVVKAKALLLKQLNQKRIDNGNSVLITDVAPISEMISGPGWLWGSKISKTNDSFWYFATNTVTYDTVKELTFKVIRWFKEIYPLIEIDIYENRILDITDGAAEQIERNFLQLLRDAKSEGIPINRVGSEDADVWIYAPPQKERMTKTINAILEMGYELAPTQLVVTISDKDVIWDGRPRTVNTVPEKQVAKALIFETYFDVLLPYGAFGTYSPINQGIDSWPESIRTKNALESDAHLFGKDGKPTISYYALLRKMVNFA